MGTGAEAWLEELTVRAEAPWLSMGTRALHDAPVLIAASDADTALLSYKESLLASARGEVVVSSPEALRAANEAASLVAETLGRSLDPRRTPLEAAALMVPEDLALLVRRDGTWRFAGGVVCFPSHWSPRAKLGLPVAQVHGPVPGYADELADRVDHFLDRLRAGRPAWRRNWTIHRSAELHAPRPAPAGPTVEVADHWLRSERQCLVALPRSGAILFTIRTEQVPLSSLASRRELAALLARALRDTPGALARYRFADFDTDAVASWLEMLAT